MFDVGAIERVKRVRAGEKNVGGTERVARGLVGPSLIVVGIAAIAGIATLASGTAGLALAAVAILAGLRMTQTAVTQRCYVNAILGRNSCSASATGPEPTVEGTG